MEPYKINIIKKINEIKYIEIQRFILNFIQLIFRFSNNFDTLNIQLIRHISLSNKFIM